MSLYGKYPERGVLACESVFRNFAERDGRRSPKFSRFCLAWSAWNESSWQLCPSFFPTVFIIVHYKQTITFATESWSFDHTQHYYYNYWVHIVCLHLPISGTENSQCSCKYRTGCWWCGGDWSENMPDRKSKFQIDPKDANKYIFPLVSQDTQNNAKSVLFPISYRPSSKSKTNNLSLKSGKKCLHAFPKAPNFVILD